MTKQHPTPNDQRSQVKDPSTKAYEADRKNRIELGHPNVPPPPPPKVQSGGANSGGKKR
ncbi:hypothetical protein [Polyangium sp. 6x1]|uniref:hypothetical protein n=1 Tax=Polyangium sp. 6x1 TaxID=3042689 RepID=UPI002482E7FE|nr:hypothetical protein [Polyangium sp. 6x1]MDI1450811.1 hypothetical protein [Polyangium sp. 6x1]